MLTSQLAIKFNSKVNFSKNITLLKKNGWRVGITQMMWSDPWN